LLSRIIGCTKIHAHTFDPAKSESNRQKHGIALSEAVLLEWETLWAIEDNRQDYGELRMIGFAYLGLRLVCVVFTDRGEERRIISLCRANKREERKYAEA